MLRKPNNGRAPTFKLEKGNRAEVLPEDRKIEIAVFADGFSMNMSEYERNGLLSEIRGHIIEFRNKGLLDGIHLAYLLPGEVMRSEGVPEGIDNEQMNEYRLKMLDEILLDNEQMNIKLQRVMMKRAEFSRNLLARVKEILEEHYMVVEDTVVQVLLGRLGGHDEELEEVFRQRLGNIDLVSVIDPILYEDYVRGGFEENESGSVITINGFYPEVLSGYAHEIIHALQSKHFLWELDENGDDEDWGDGNLDIYSPRSVRVGMQVDRGREFENDRVVFRALNEAVTEHITRKVILPILKNKIPSLDEGVDLSYLKERDQFAELIDFIDDEVGEAEAYELLDMVYDAVFKDDVNADRGRAYYFRKLSKAMRGYFGDGALVAIDKEMEKHINRCKGSDDEDIWYRSLDELRAFLESRFRVSS